MEPASPPWLLRCLGPFPRRRARAERLAGSSVSAPRRAALEASGALSAQWTAPIGAAAAGFWGCASAGSPGEIPTATTREFIFPPAGIY